METNISDKNLRAYAVSIDWLQLHTRATYSFSPEIHPLGYMYEDIGHGSKVFRRILNVWDSDGCLIGNISLDPYSPSIRKDTVIFKAENQILYEPEAIPRIFSFLAAAGLEYIGITRLDIAYDCHEYYGGMKPQSLIDRYFATKILKLGNNDPWVKMVGGYKLKFRANNSQKLKLDGNQQNIGKFVAQSVTWGQRSSDVQVQVYNKSAELREVKMKHHIVDWWKQNGLTPNEKDVFRTEIRITGFKTFRNQKTLRVFKLNASDLVMQEQVEHLFTAMASKYFRFFRRKDITHIERMPEIRLLCIGKTPVFKPLHVKNRKDYTRGTKTLLNWMAKHIAANAKEKNAMTFHLQKVQEYLEETYRIGDVMKRTNRNNEITHIQNPNDYNSIYDYYADFYAAGDTELYDLAAENQRKMEEKEDAEWEELEDIHAKVVELAERYESEDPSGRWKKDFETYSQIITRYEELEKKNRDWQKAVADANFYASMRKMLRDKNNN